MTIGLLGKKIGMTQIFKENGEAAPATVIEAGPCYILQIKTKEKEGYSAIQCGFEKQKERRLNKPALGKFKKINVEPLKIVREIRIKENDEDKYKIGDEIKADLFEAGDYIDITGTSIGKGFQGVMKRWNFKGQPASHGSKIHRAPGSIGASATPSRVVKGKRMPGQMGNKRVTVQNIEILKVDVDNHLLIIRGSIPGKKGNYLIINKAKKRKKKAEKSEEKKEESKESREKNNKR